MVHLFEKVVKLLNTKDAIADRYNTIIGAFIAVMSTVFGEHWYLFAAFLAFNILDFFTGWQKVRVLKQESSAKGLSGAVKKVWYWVLVLVAFIISNTFVSLGKNLLALDLGFLTFFGWFTLAALTINEARSILENLVELGVPVPEFLSKGLVVTHKMLNDKAIVSDTDEKK